MSRPGSAPNGWVVYTQGQQPKATLGSRPFGRKPLVAELEAGCAMLGTLEPSQVGSVAKVQALLEAQAALFVPLELVAVAGEAGGGTDGTTITSAAAGGDSGGGSALSSALLRSCVHAVPRDGIRSSYSRLVALFQHQPSVARRRRASKGAQEGGVASSYFDDARNRARELAEACPGAFFHVALDCPGYGGSGGSTKAIRTDPLRLLQDVITALAKPHAYAIVGCSQANPNPNPNPSPSPSPSPSPNPNPNQSTVACSSVRP